MGGWVCGCFIFVFLRVLSPVTGTPCVGLTLWLSLGCGEVVCCVVVCADTVVCALLARRRVKMRNYGLTESQSLTILRLHTVHTRPCRAPHTHTGARLSKWAIRSADAVTAVFDRFGPSWPNSHLGSPHAKFWARVLRYFSPCYGLLPPLHKRRDGARDATSTTSIAGTCYRGFVRRAS